MPDIILLAGPTDPRTTLFQATPSKLRIDSPGSDLQALQIILEKGSDELQAKGDAYYWPKQQITEAIGQKGRLIPSHQYYAGLSVLFRGLETLTSNALPKLS